MAPTTPTQAAGYTTAEGEFQSIELGVGTLEVTPSPPAPRRSTAGLLLAMLMTGAGFHTSRARGARPVAPGRCTSCKKKEWDCRCRRPATPPAAA